MVQLYMLDVHRSSQQRTGSVDDWPESDKNKNCTILDRNTKSRFKQLIHKPKQIKT